MIEIILGVVILALGAILFVLYKKNMLLDTQNKLYSEQVQSKDFALIRMEEQSKSLKETNENQSKELEEITTKLSNLVETNTQDKTIISELQTKLQEQTKSANEKLELLKENEEKLKIEFKNLANDIFENNSKKLTEQNKQNLGQLIEPMKTQISEFKKKVEDVYDKEAKDRSLLSAELKHLKELNLKISTDAINLTNALTGQKKQQGIWGEMVLEKVLESSGLREGHEYKREVSLKDEENTTFRPDVIVNLPDERHIIIDAKTSLNSYNQYTASEDELDKQTHLKSHIFAIKEHIKSLATKRYEDLQDINSLDFIFMFVPIESALLIALENDVNLYDEAFKQKIILVSPTTLLVALRAVENTWRYERQAQSIADVAKRAELLYNKFVGFVDDLQKVGDSLKKADDAYNKAFGKLSDGSGNLISQATMLKKVSNIKPKKELPKDLIDS
jgi:DNA recombination protein RmuC